MVTNLQKEILRQVILVQVASDSGKFKEVKCTAPGTETSIDMGYSAKFTHIEKAVKLINTAPPCGITESVSAPSRQKEGEFLFSVMIYYLGTYHNRREEVVYDLWLRQYPAETGQVLKLSKKGGIAEKVPSPRHSSFSLLSWVHGGSIVGGDAYGCACI